MCVRTCGLRVMKWLDSVACKLLVQLQKQNHFSKYSALFQSLRKVSEFFVKETYLEA